MVKVTRRKMTGRTLLTIIATASVAGCAGTGGPPPFESLGYVVPRSASALYEIGDTMSIDMDTPAGSMAITGGTSVTLGLNFQRRGGGNILVETGVEAFEGTMTHPMMGTQRAGMDHLSGYLEVAMSERGVEEVVSFPLLAGPVAQISPFSAIPYLLFPHMPDGDVTPGVTWVDTVSVTTEAAEATTAINTVSTYTLVGDTLVDGRTLVRVAVATEITTDTEAEEGGMSITQSVAGSSEGFFLWDPELRLLAHAEYDRNLEGTVSMGNMGTMSLTITGPTRIRLER